jgi:hypothetical protein
MMLILTLAAGLLAAPEPQAEPQKGWVVEIHGFTYHPKQAEPPKGKGRIILEGEDTYAPKQPVPRKEFIIEFQWKPQPEPVPIQVEAVEAFYVDDLPAFFKQLKKR